MRRNWRLPNCVLAPKMATSDAPDDFRACACRRPTSLRQPDVFRASQPGPTSVLHPGDFLAPGRLPNVCSTEPNFRCRINDGCVRQTWRLRPKRVCPRTGVTLTAASTARGLPKTTSADDKTRSAGYQPSAPCAERRQFLCILNSPAGP